MRKTLIVAFLLVVQNLSAQEGIQFQHGTWAQTKELAIKENKLIFADFYTQWCRPCYDMAKNVFTLHSVGMFYNANFVNMKIDAEDGEGIELAKKYAVRSYPTYCFIDPKTEEIVHRCGSNIPAEAFIFVGQSALNPKTTSVYLEKEWAAGNKSADFLLAYANYSGSCYKRNETILAAQELIKMTGYGLDNPEVWKVFIEYVSGGANSLFTELKANLDKYRTLYGPRAVDAKFFVEYTYATNLAELDALPLFNGKEFLIKKVMADIALRGKNYQEASRLYDELMSDPGEFKAELCKVLAFITARPPVAGTCPDFWLDKCLEMTKYVAYNNPEREEAQAHFNYARQLELKLNRLNVSLVKPIHGAQEYSMRPVDLKAKSTRKK